jgi:hypothetical protein
MRAERYMLLMLKHLSARGNLFLFVRTHRHLEYYFNLSDTHRAANQNIAGRSPVPARMAKVIAIRPISRAAPSAGAQPVCP